MALSEKERAEMQALAKAASERDGIPYAVSDGGNPFIIDGGVCTERAIEFLMHYNELVGHQMKPPRPFIEKNMKL